jgi:hypothetical protein
LEKIKIIMSHNYKNNQNTKVAKNIWFSDIGIVHYAVLKFWNLRSVTELYWEDGFFWCVLETEVHTYMLVLCVGECVSVCVWPMIIKKIVNNVNNILYSCFYLIVMYIICM